jgi:hypothetical protein
MWWSKVYFYWPRGFGSLGPIAIWSLAALAHLELEQHDISDIGEQL